jgi:uncharacterized protein Veg
LRKEERYQISGLVSTKEILKKKEGQKINSKAKKGNKKEQ